MTERRDLTKLFEPESVLLVGATGDTFKWGGWVSRSFGDTKHLRTTHFVSLRGGELYGLPVHTSIADVPGPVDLAVIVVPAPGVPQAVTESLALGAKALVIITSGFGEASAEGERVQQALVEEVRAAGAVLLGPNCLGLFDDRGQLNVYGGTFPSGDLGFATQSGNLALEVALLLERSGLGLTRFASVGNQADLTLADVIRDFAHHEATKVIGAYIEAPRDGRAFADAVREAAAVKPVVLFAGGRTAAGAHAAASHTGNLAAESRVLRAICRDAGAVVVDSPGQFVDAVATLRTGKSLGRRRIGIVADGGGHGVVASDTVIEAGLEMAVFSEATREAMRPLLRHNEPDNPVDLAGVDASLLWNFHGLVDVLLKSPEVDAVLMSGYFGGYGAYEPEAGEVEIDVAEAIARSSDEHGKPVVIQSMEEASGNATIRRLREVDVPVYSRIENAVDALVRLERPPIVHVEQASGVSLDGIWVERMADAGGVDLVVGARRDPSFGPVILVGVGGVFVEILDDVVLSPAPTDPVHLAGLMKTLRAFPMLAGARGQEPVDCLAVAEIAVRLGDLLVQTPEISEVEINPLRATATGAIALDARIVC